MRWLRKRARQLRRNSSDIDRMTLFAYGIRETNKSRENRREKIIMQPTGVLETSKATNPLHALLSYGQSMWLDYIRRDLITSGSLKRMIDEDGLRGMTSNPAIFEK